MAKVSKDVIGKDVSREGFGDKVKDAGRGETVTGRPLKRVSEHKVKDVIGKNDRKGGDEPERVFNKIDKDAINKRYANAEVEGGADMAIGKSSARHGIIKN